MNESALAQKIKNIILNIRTEETDPDESMNYFCNQLAKVIIEEVRKLEITATCPTGKVSVIKIN